MAGPAVCHAHHDAHRRERGRTGAVLLGALLAGLVLASPDAPAGEAPPRLTVEALQSLQFGQVTTEGGRGGWVVIEPATGQKSVHGNAIDLHGSHRPARFQVTGPPHAPFLITLPETVELAAGSAGRAILRDFTSSPPREGVLGFDGQAIIDVGATLALDPGTDRVSYSGSFTIHVDPLE